MKNMTVKNITEVCGGIYYGSDDLLSKEVEGIALDSRKIEKDWLFVATIGQKVDGHSYIAQAAGKGAFCALGEKAPETIGLIDKEIAYIQVKDSFQALKDLAAFYLKQLSVKVVGITGSVGKTSTKEMIAGVLAEKYHVLKTEGNFNNEVGLPLTVFRLRQEHEVAVLEMGISDFGEMHRLAAIARPDIAVITNIGQCHLENLGDRDGVLRAKTEVFDEMKPDGEVVLNGDDDKLSAVKEVHGRSPYFFHKVDCEAWTVEQQGAAAKDHVVYGDCIVSHGLYGSQCRIHVNRAGKAESFAADIKVPGVHQVNNALAATAVGLLFGLTNEQIRAGIAKVKPLAGRTNLMETPEYTLVDDCYNANPVSMKAALDLLCMANGRKVAVLGDMFELGTDSDALHAGVGTYAAGLLVDVLCMIGPNSRHMYDAAIAADQGLQKRYYFEDKQAFLAKKSEILQKGDTILLKASHGMEFGELIEALKE
ncbi:MAG: UDP-N-acetylmuramoyl-tripeptide--D-alanyl-D-alanine ligase [Lachnospiraceae bacterium]|jgi:UDP-N-acetylmuramoyl-tripeptide--D-alanyl-D-alanine ligase|nr:UDP-N-acetylmuramoyl-tripeptide--D-alanyl-D-alanine ligase [Lachnospiraceae bacterium]